MPYITPDDVRSRMTQQVYENLLNTADLPNETARTEFVSEICDSASGMVDAYLRGAYSVPLSDAAAIDVVKPLALAIAEYMLWQRTAMSDIPPRVTDAYNNAIQQLRDIALGRMQLPVTEEEEAEIAAEGLGWVIESERPLFTGDESGFDDAY